MRQESSPLDSLMPVLRQLILAELLVRSPDEPVYRVELARRLGVPASSLQRPLSAMVRSGILRTVHRGRVLLYEPDRDSPLFSDLRSLMRKTRGLVDVLRSALKPLAKHVRVAFVYGSMAAGNERANSDVDLFVVGDVSLGDLSRALADAEATLGREVNAVGHTEEQLRAKARAKNHFVRWVLDKPRLFVVGTEDELAAFTGGALLGGR